MDLLNNVNTREDALSRVDGMSSLFWGHAPRVDGLARRLSLRQHLPQQRHGKIDKTSYLLRHEGLGWVKDVHRERIRLELLEDNLSFPCLIASAA